MTPKDHDELLGCLALIACGFLALCTLCGLLDVVTWLIAGMFA